MVLKKFAGFNLSALLLVRRGHQQVGQQAQRVHVHEPCCRFCACSHRSRRAALRGGLQGAPVKNRRRRLRVPAPNHSQQTFEFSPVPFIQTVQLKNIFPDQCPIMLCFPLVFPECVNDMSDSAHLHSGSLKPKLRGGTMPLSPSKGKIDLSLPPVLLIQKLTLS